MVLSIGRRGADSLYTGLQGRLAVSPGMLPVDVSALCLGTSVSESTPLGATGVLFPLLGPVEFERDQYPGQ